MWGGSVSKTLHFLEYFGWRLKTLQDSPKTLQRLSTDLPKGAPRLPKTFQRPSQDLLKTPQVSQLGLQKMRVKTGLVFCTLQGAGLLAPRATLEPQAPGPGICAPSWGVWGPSSLQAGGSGEHLGSKLWALRVGYGETFAPGAPAPPSPSSFLFFSFSPSFSLFSLIRPGQIWRTNKGFFFFSSFLPSFQSFYSFSLIRPGQLVRTNGGFFTFLLLLLYILLVLLLQVGVWKPSWPQVGGPWGNLVSKLGGLGTILAPS